MDGGEEGRKEGLVIHIYFIFFSFLICTFFSSSIDMAVTTAAASSLGGGGGGGGVGIIHQGTLLKVVKNIFPYHSTPPLYKLH